MQESQRRLSRVAALGILAAVTATHLGALGESRPGAGGAQDPAWSPDGKRVAIAFQQRIYLVSPQGRGGRPLVQWDGAPPIERDPAWSADGRRLAFAADAGAGFAVYVVDAKGGRATRVTNVAGEARWPSWTPDNRLVFAVHDETSWDLATAGTDGCDVGCPVDRLTTGADDEREPVVSPDGSRVLFVSDRENEDRDPDLWVMALPASRRGGDGEPEKRGRGPTRVLRARGAEFAPSWSPDGTRVAFGADREGVGSVWVASVPPAPDGSGRVPRETPPTGPVLLSRTAGQPAWSPEGDVILVADLPMPEPTYNGNPLRAPGDPLPLFHDAYRLRLLPAPLLPDEGSQAVGLGVEPDPAQWRTSFERVWSLLSRLYFAQGDAHAAWEALAGRFRPRAAAARDERELETVVDEMIARQPAIKPPVTSAGGAVVVSGHRLASEAGARILAQGGNVVDAAVAVSLALGVVEPDASGLGGDGMALVFLNGMAHPVAVDFKDQVPSRATLDNPKIFRAGRIVADGPAAANIPGVVAGIDLMHRRFGSGKVSWADLVAPAVTLAEDGYVLDEALPTTIAEGRGYFRKWPEAEKIYLPDGRVPRAGDRFRNPDLAGTLRVLAREGAESFYRGSLARRIAADMTANGGIIALDDLAQYQAIERTPLEGRYRGNTVFAAPPPVPAGASLLETLQILDRYQPHAPGRYAADADLLHYLIESWKVRDANRRIADPAIWPVDLGEHLTAAHADALFARIRPKEASATMGDSGERDPSSDAVTGQGDRIGRGTTAFAVGDAEGNLVVVTQTLSTWGGTFYVSKGLGFLYNNHLRSNRTTRGAYGQLMPLLRSASTSAPTIVFRGEGERRQPWFAVGAAGNAWIPASVYSVVSAIVDGGLSMQQAIEAPRLLVARDPADPFGAAARVQIEDRFPRAVLDDLVARGHRFQKIGRKGELRYGYASGVLVHPDTRVVEGGAEPRRSHAAVAVP